MESIELTVLMPCLNECEGIASSIGEAKECIDKYEISAEILIADNGSTDGSQKIAESLGARVINVPERGYGNALIGGINAAIGKYIIMGDCDGSYNFSDIYRILIRLREGYSLVMGNRFTGGIEKGAMPFLHRKIGVPFLSWLGRVKFKTDVGDFHCGLRGFDREKALSLNLKCGGMEFATEIIASFAKLSEKICEIPTPLRVDKRKGASHLRTLRDGMRHLIYIIRNS